MSTRLLNSLMNAQSQTATPAGQQMQVVMIPSRNIIPNPENFEIYTLADGTEVATSPLATEV